MQESPFVINLYKYSTTSKLMLVRKKSYVVGIRTCDPYHTTYEY